MSHATRPGVAGHSFYLVAFTILLVTVSSFTWGCRNQAHPVSGSEVASREQEANNPSDGQNPVGGLVERWQTQLMESGWTEEAAKSVIMLNHEYLARVHRADPDELNLYLTLLKRLADWPSVQQELKTSPELAGMLAGSLTVDPEGPTLILKTLKDAKMDERVILQSLYLMSAAPRDCVALANNINRATRHLLIRLCRKGQYEAVTWFSDLPRGKGARHEYLTWLRQVFVGALDSSDPNELARSIAFLMIHSQTVRTKLDADMNFQQQFLKDLWPKYTEILDRKMKEKQNKTEKTNTWGIYQMDPRVWDLFNRFPERGPGVFETHSSVAIDLLVSDRYPKYQEGVMQALQSKHRLMIEALYDEALYKLPLFHELLQRGLPQATLTTAMQELLNDSSKQPDLLQYWDGLPKNTLVEALAPPPEGFKTWLPGYSIYYLGRKYAQGRRITGMDMAMAAIDVVELAVPIARAGKVASPALKQTAKTTAKKKLKDAAKKNLKDAALKGPKSKFGKHLAGTGLSKTTSDKVFVPWLLSDARSRLAKSVRQLRERDLLDITSMYRTSFATSGIGRKTFKRISKLEPRIFMRRDRRVVISLSEQFDSQHFLGIYLRETAINAGFEKAFEIPAVQDAVETSTRAVIAAARSSARQLEAWKQHIAAWWLYFAVADNRTN